MEDNIEIISNGDNDCMFYPEHYTVELDSSFVLPARNGRLVQHKEIGALSHNGKCYLILAPAKYTWDRIISRPYKVVNYVHFMEVLIENGTITRFKECTDPRITISLRVKLSEYILCTFELDEDEE
ncbi:MAG: hypothetical protein LBE09_02325 [Christensenellaceae bacterium]|jgi:hypothetical protein|nr:hypothetical protein [Christensenellaceae bacterium]